MKYKNVLIKFSGEAFGDKGKPVNKRQVKLIASEIKELVKAKVKVAIVCGGGNVSRWKDVKKGDRVEVDLKGMKGGLKNVIPLEKALKEMKVKVQVFTSFSLNTKYPKFNYSKVTKALKENKVVIFVGGTGHPFFTHDTAACLRALETNAEVLIKATKVDGIYSADPTLNKRAKRIKSISYKSIIAKELKIIDSVAVALAQENKLPIRIIKWQEGNLIKLIKGKNLGSIIK
ncbi:UMP kinase [bacterium]|jgi:uridylate kinase|nr:UMP kinase [bacterium]MBT4122105.1 UMP kinase [bacterium]MBT4335383.1 UMP kinase [bacterium]MBT4495502.1 UMP kinase [bacterium]MBT4764314.1 UMP kinase [bacterium]